MFLKKRIIFAGLLTLVFLNACSTKVLTTGDEKTPRPDPHVTVNTILLDGPRVYPGLPSTPKTPNICNPFTGKPEATVQKWNGIKASLRYIPYGNATPTNLASFPEMSNPVDANIYFSSFNTPTQLFSRGFAKKDGIPLTDPYGKTLDEWFMLQMDSKLRLAPWQKPGLRQFALLSDDGSILKMDLGNGLVNHIDNDTTSGGHESRLACGSTAVWLGQGRDLPIHLDYYQGPRYHAALMLLWRIIPDQYGTGEENSPILNSNSLYHVSCGVTGNETFFNPNVVPSQPTAVWNQLMTDGWEVVPAINYVLPGSDPKNPCFETPQGE